MKKTDGKGIGKGHGGNTPNLPVIREIELPPNIMMMIAQGLIQDGTKAFRMGRARIMLSPPTDISKWHMTISRPDRYPTWDEIAKARYELMPDNLFIVMSLPPPDEYINVHNYCFHLHEGSID